MINLSKKTCRITFFSALVLFVASIGFKLVLTGNLAVRNDELEEAFASRSELEKMVSRLKFESSELSCMELIEERAKRLGFIEMQENLLSLDIEAPDQVAVLTQ
jgi:biopolymer transport protein ExbB/TolQ